MDAVEAIGFCTLAVTKKSCFCTIPRSKSPINYLLLLILLLIKLFAASLRADLFLYVNITFILKTIEVSHFTHIISCIKVTLFTSVEQNQKQ
jgi:hypothetical protein